MEERNRSLKLNWNGLYITTETPGRTVPRDSLYRGPAYGESWPLSPHKTADRTVILSPEEEKLVARMWEETAPHQNPEGCPASESPDVWADVSLANDYVQCCRNHGIALRVLLCATPSPYPALASVSVVESLLKGARHLGYDYWDGGELSGLWEVVLPEFSVFRDRLNAFGLFDERNVLEDYILLRDELEVPLDLERSPWMTTDVWEVNLPFGSPTSGALQ